MLTFLLQFEGRKFANVKVGKAYENAVETARQIQQFNMKFFGALLKQSKDEPDPEGYQCVNRTENQTEIEYDEEIFCFLKSVPTCSKVIEV